MSFVRSSKFRHVFGTASKSDKCYSGVKVTKSPHDSNMSAVNSKFIAVVLEAQGGGAFFVAPLSKMGRFDINYPKVSGHKQQVLDLAWNPFDDNQIASGAEDCKIMLWRIPDEGLTENLANCEVELVGHQKKVMQVLWHPSASNVLASAGFDHVIYIWNTTTAEVMFELVHPESLLCMSWSYNGSMIASTCKDKKIRVFNVRSQEIISEGEGHLGTKTSRVVFCGTTNKLFTTGFSRGSERQYAVWDAGNLSKSLNMTKYDDGTGVMFPFWDEGTKMVYLIGKGDQKLPYFEVTEEAPYVYFLTMHQTSQPYRSMACVPKKDVDFMHCEVMKFYGLITKGTIEPLSMKVPRKSDMFQDDIFPPCPSGEPSQTAEEWASGQDKDPKLLKFNATGLEATTKGPRSMALKVTAPAPKSTPKTASASSSSSSKPPSVQRQSSGTGSGQGSRGHTPDLTDADKKELEWYRKAYKELEEENKRLKEQLGMA